MKINGEDLSNIKKNVNEIGYYNSLTKIFKKIFIIIISIIIVFTLFEVISLYKMKSEYNLNKNILNNGQKYEKSIYIKYEGKIYCNSFGDIYQLKDADIDSFKIFLGFLLVLGFIFIVFFLYLAILNKKDIKNIDKMLLEKYRNIKPISKDYNDKE